MPKWRPIWVADYKNLDDHRSKAGSKHGIDIDDFAMHSKVNKQLRGYDEDDLKHGIRTVIEVQLSNQRRVRAYLDLVDPALDLYSIRSVRFID